MFSGGLGVAQWTAHATQLPKAQLGGLSGPGSGSQSGALCSLFLEEAFGPPAPWDPAVAETRGTARGGGASTKKLQLSKDVLNTDPALAASPSPRTLSCAEPAREYSGPHGGPSRLSPCFSFCAES